MRHPDPDIDRALDHMAKATTATEAMDWLWTAHDRGASWRECRKAYDEYEAQRGRR